MAILIKRYANRKLYNTDTSRYITLKGIATLLDAGEEVRVIDNETGDDITQIALSQILVDNKRAKEDPSDTLLSQILSRGGDALYGAIRKSVDDASEGIGDFQDRFRQFVSQTETITRGARPFAWDRREADDDESDSSRDAATDHASEGGFDEKHTELRHVVRETVAQVLDAYDLPTRRDLAELDRKLDRITRALEGAAETAARSDEARDD